MVKSPLVSVCMITFNHANYLRKAIEGILIQKTNFDIELVIGEDHSTDNTRSICLEYVDKYPGMIRLTNSEKNLGMVMNFIQTQSECRGKYLAICEGDDYWTESDKLQKQVEFMEANPDFGMVHTDADVLFQKTGVLIPRYNYKMKWVIPDNDIYDLLIRGIFIKTLTVLMRKKIVDEFYLNVSSEHWTIGDFPLFLYIARQSKVKYFNYTTGVYRILENSATHHRSFKDRAGFLRGLSDIELYFADHFGCSKDARDQILKNYNERKIEIGYYELNNKIAKEGYDFLRGRKKLDTKYLLLYLGSKNNLIQKLIDKMLTLKKLKRIALEQN